MFKKSLLALALAGASMGAQAVSVTSMTITEVGSAWTGGTAHVAANTGIGTAAGTSGGAFYFVGFLGPVPNGSATGTSSFGSTGAGIINGSTQTSFGGSFDFGTGATFTPNTCGNSASCAVTSSMAATVSGVDTLVIDLSHFGGFYSALGAQFRLDPQVFTGPGAVLNLEVHNSALGAGGLAANQFYYSLDWAHSISSASGDVDPVSTSFDGFVADWHIEGIGTVAAVPEASTYGMMLAGLGLVGFAARRRKQG